MVFLSFNPHTHEGCDTYVPESLKQKNSFNPHTHEGCDAGNTLGTGADSVSIHTPTKGVTVTLKIILRV